MNHVIVYFMLFLLTIVNIVVPFSGAVSTTPLLAVLTTTHNAIVISAFFYFASSLVRLSFFYRFVRWDYVRTLLPIVLCGAVLGALALIALPDTFATVILFCFVLYFFIATIRNKPKEKIYSKKRGAYVPLAVGALSGFFQGSGFAGSDLRNGYLYAEGLSLSEVQGTASVIGGATFLTATIVRLCTHQIQIPDLMIVVYLLPVLILGTHLGKKAIVKLRKEYSQILVLLIMGIALLVIAHKLAILFI
jgi:uncharacterized membrane protein YfcA